MEDLYRRMLGSPLFVGLFFKLPHEDVKNQGNGDLFVEIAGLGPPLMNWIN